jgi:hypothetical protein
LEVRRRRDVAEALRGQRATWPDAVWSRPEPVGAAMFR